jgi:hypothetical protein
MVTSYFKAFDVWARRELLAEQSPGERAGLYDSPEEAIRAHAAEFWNEKALAMAPK